MLRLGWEQGGRRENATFPVQPDRPTFRSGRRVPGQTNPTRRRQALARLRENEKPRVAPD